MIITTVSRKAQTWWPPKWWQRGRKRHRMFSGIACIGTSWPAPADGRRSRGRSRRGSRSGGSGSSSWTSSGRSLCCGGWTSPKSPFSSRQKIGWNNWRSKEAPRAIIHWQDLQWSQYPFTPTGARHAVKTCLRYMLLLFFVVFNKFSFSESSDMEPAVYQIIIHANIGKTPFGGFCRNHMTGEWILLILSPADDWPWQWLPLRWSINQYFTNYSHGYLIYF